MGIGFSMKIIKNLKKLALITASLWIGVSNAEIPENYYDTADDSSSTALRDSLHEIIDDHQRFPYTSSATDTWDILEIADQNPDDPSSIIDIYKNASYLKETGGNDFYNREHTWPKSYGFPDDGVSNYPYTDMHHLFLSDSGYNSSRSNKPFADCDSGCSENATLFNNNRGGGANDSNWTSGSFADGNWETWDARKGDVARALMYMAIRYEGGAHGDTGFAEPDLILTDDRNLIDASSTGSNGSVAYMGLRSVLIQWHKDDPVDDFERRHTDAVYDAQGNRNPFIDHPEYVECVFESICGGVIDILAPDAPTNLFGESGNPTIELTWDANIEADLAGYNIYRTEVSDSTTIKLNTSIQTDNSFIDSEVNEFVTYFYTITAVDTSFNESEFSLGIVATAGEVTSVSLDVWINEFHYDNASTDVGEFIEIAGTAGTDLSGWSLVLYNGNNGTTYQTVNLSGVIIDEQNGFGTLSFDISGIQNGGPDGFALVDDTGSVEQFLSYEGTFAAIDGVADGMLSDDVDVSETSSTLEGDSLQLVGSGSTYSDFTWQSPAAESAGFVNLGQTIAIPNELPTAFFTFSCSGLVCDFDASNSVDPDGDITNYAWTFGDGNLGQDITTGYTYIGEGSYSVTLEVTDNNGAVATQTQTVDVAEIIIPEDAIVWINEFHYDNTGADTGEFIEIVGIVGTDLSGWSLVLYNGNGGAVYQTINLTGIISNEINGYGALSFDTLGLQNGGPDGFALVDNNGAVVQFLSYEGSFTAVGGVADGLVSTDVGVSEASSTLIGDSLQLVGTGTSYSQFTWQTVSAESPGLINSGQSFPGLNQLPTASFTFSCVDLTCDFDASESVDFDGEIVSYDWDLGDGNLDTGADVNYSYLNAGSFDVTLTVTDNGGAFSSATQTIEVTESTETSLFENNTVMAIPDRSRIVSTIDVDRTGLAGTVEVSVNITHTYRGDLVIKVQSPDGTIYPLKAKDRFDNGQDVIETYTIDATGNADGVWKLVVRDTARVDVGQLNNWSVKF